MRSVDYTVTDTATILSVVGNTITFASALAFTPLTGYVMELASYTGQPDNVKLKYGFQTDDANDFPDSGKPYVMF